MRLSLGLFVGLLLLCGAPEGGLAQGHVRGTVRADDGRPLPVVYVMALTDQDARLDPVAYALSDSAGAFSLRNLPAGTFWLRVRRVGWQLSEAVPVTVRDGETTSFDLQANSSPVSLAALRVVAEAPCVSLNALPADSPILELYATAADAVRARIAATRAYRFRVHRVVDEIRRGASTEWTELEDTTYEFDPPSEGSESVSASARRSASTRADDLLFGRHERKLLTPWRQSLHLTAPSDGLLLSDAFRRTYCVVTTIDRDAAGDPQLRFRRVQPNARIVTADVRIRFDRVSGRMAEVEYGYRFRDRAAGTGIMEFRDVVIDGEAFAWFSLADLTVFDPAGTGEELLRKRFRDTAKDFERVRD